MIKKGNKVVTGLLLAGVAFAALNVIAYRHAYAMMHFTTEGGRTRPPERLGQWAKLKVLLSGVTIPRPTCDLSASAVDPGCQPLIIDAPGGIHLAGWYCGRGRDTPLVILFHGYSSEKTSLVEESKAFLALGASVLMVDFRGSGGSSEAYTTIGVREAEDVVAVFRYAERSLPHVRRFLFGQSMGAVAILRAVSHHGIAPDGVLLEAVFDTLLNTVRNRFTSMRVPAFPCAQLLVFWGGLQWHFDGFQHNPVEYAKALRCPALFMHGADDPRATLEEGRRVFDAVPPGGKVFQSFPNCGHHSYVTTQPVEWTGAVKRFIETVMIAPLRRADR